MKRAFVTGATGFIGLNLIEKLLSKQWQVTALHLPGEDLKYLSRFKVTPVAGNILDYSSLTAAIPDGCDVVFHLAGDTSTWAKEAERQYNINVNGSIHMCRAAMERRVGRFVLTSSSSAFGYHDCRISEQTVSNALSCGMNYHRTKYLAELEARKYVGQGLDAVILNPCNIIGPYDQRNWSQLIINVSRNRMPGYPPGSGTFAHVRDIAEAHIAAAEKGTTGDSYLLGGVEASFKDMIHEISKATGTPLSLKEVSRRKLKLSLFLSSAQALFTRREPLLTYPKYKRLVGKLSCDDSKAARELGFATSTISEMVEDSCRWLEQEGYL
jgi:nucleoside-diphosphate-sugar epimerase